ncbi:hypothetical protein JHK87_016258 [Glycine soja]|nr:hypothetical protein JHK87_016258 [Glycine soja]
MNTHPPAERPVAKPGSGFRLVFQLEETRVLLVTKLVVEKRDIPLGQCYYASSASRVQIHYEVPQVLRSGALAFDSQVVSLLLTMVDLDAKNLEGKTASDTASSDDMKSILIKDPGFIESLPLLRNKFRNFLLRFRRYMTEEERNAYLVISSHLGRVRSIVVNPSNISKFFCSSCSFGHIRDLSSRVLKLTLISHIEQVRALPILCLSSVFATLPLSTTLSPPCPRHRALATVSSMDELAHLARLSFCQVPRRSGMASTMVAATFLARPESPTQVVTGSHDTTIKM